MAESLVFRKAFEALTGHAPFPWQERLFTEWFAEGKIPSSCNLPTGLGKTNVIDRSPSWRDACAACECRICGSVNVQRTPKISRDSEISSVARKRPMILIHGTTQINCAT